jgi:hypothetical protein
LRPDIEWAVLPRSGGIPVAVAPTGPERRRGRTRLWNVWMFWSRRAPLCLQRRQGGRNSAPPWRSAPSPHKPSHPHPPIPQSLLLQGLQKRQQIRGFRGGERLENAERHRGDCGLADGCDIAALEGDCLCVEGFQGDDLFRAIDDEAGDGFVVSGFNFEGGILEIDELGGRGEMFEDLGYFAPTLLRSGPSSRPRLSRR